MSAGFRGGNTPLVLDLALVLAGGVFLGVACYTAFRLQGVAYSLPFKLLVAALLLIFKSAGFRLSTKSKQIMLGLLNFRADVLYLQHVRLIFLI